MIPMEFIQDLSLSFILQILRYWIFIVSWVSGSVMKENIFSIGVENVQ